MADGQATLRRQGREAEGPVEVVIDKRLTTAHQLAYYFPEEGFLTLDDGCPKDNLKLPPDARVAFLLGKSAPPVSGAGLQKRGPFLVADASQREFRIGACRIVVVRGQ